MIIYFAKYCITGKKRKVLKIYILLYLIELSIYLFSNKTVNMIFKCSE